MRNLVLLITFLFLLTSCMGEKQAYAPVYDVEQIESIPITGTLRVKPGDTLYSISWQYGLDHRYLALRNNLTPPYEIYVGQKIYLTGKIKINRSVKKISKKEKPTLSSLKVVDDRLPKQVGAWTWPTKGQVVNYFGTQNKGINISGHYNQFIYAAAAGKVVYSGNGLRSYGNLIIIKHTNDLLTAYAHNSINLVQEGDRVKRGQPIARMGMSHHRAMLHFEIRLGGKPVNPLYYFKNS